MNSRKSTSPSCMRRRERPAAGERCSATSCLRGRRTASLSHSLSRRRSRTSSRSLKARAKPRESSLPSCACGEWSALSRVAPTAAARQRQPRACLLALKSPNACFSGPGVARSAARARRREDSTRNSQRSRRKQRDAARAGRAARTVADGRQAPAGGEAGAHESAERASCALTLQATLRGSAERRRRTRGAPARARVGGGGCAALPC